MSSQTELISKRRERVIASYKEAELINYELFHNGDDKGTSEYIFPNQKEDANNIVDIFYKNNCRVVSIQKKTKVGADGLMIDMKTKNVILFSFLAVIFTKIFPTFTEFR